MSAKKKNRFAHAVDEGGTEPEFQVAPMADMLFVLLVFFMSITTTQTLQTNIEGMKIPVAESAKDAEEDQRKRDIIINIKWDRNTRLADIIVGPQMVQDPQALIPILEDRLNLNPTARVLIRADEDTEFNFVSQVMRAAGEAGIGNVSFGVMTGGERETGDKTASAN